MRKIIKEVDGIETIGQLRAALEGMDDETPVSDAMGIPLLMAHIETDEVNEGDTYPNLQYVEIK
jgi:hypothetical protein